eukprot:694108-Amphidinium_carterae.1
MPNANGWAKLAELATVSSQTTAARRDGDIWSGHTQGDKAARVEQPLRPRHTLPEWGRPRLQPTRGKERTSRKVSCGDPLLAASCATLRFTPTRKRRIALHEILGSTALVKAWHRSRSYKSLPLIDFIAAPMTAHANNN